MKNIFLAVSIFSFLFVSAQQNDVLDIQKQIQKRSEEDWKEKKKEELLSFRNWRYTPPKYRESLPQAKLSHTLPNGSKVYLLPQDNMPCLVPNMDHYGMPNVSIQKDFAIKIPNAVTPYNIIPDEKKTPYQIFLEKKKRSTSD